jgi:hypothetical protein
VRRAALALAVLALVLVGDQRPSAATGGVVVSGVAVFSYGAHVGLYPVGQPPYQQVTMTETQQGLFVSGLEAEVAGVTCTYTGGAQEEYAFSGGWLRGTCGGTGATGRPVSKVCDRSYTRAAQWLVVTESCQVQVGSTSTLQGTVMNHVAHLPPPPAGRYYYTGTGTGYPVL